MSSEKFVNLCQVEQRHIPEVSNFRNTDSHHVCVVEKPNGILKIYELFETYGVIFPKKLF
jgi:hypothetical protein